MLVKKRSYKKLSVLIGAAVVLFVGVGVTTKIINDSNKSFEEEPVVKVDENEQNTEETKEENILSPVDKSIGIVRYYYNKDDDSSKQEQSLILFEKVYYPNIGIDYSAKDTFDVKASISGKVIKKTNDPILGWVVSIQQGDVITTYDSLSAANVEVNGEVKQGDIIGKAGTNLYEADLGNHVHFSIDKKDQHYNPETYLNKSINSIK